MIEQPEPLKIFLLGVLAMGDLIAGLFFLRYWQSTRDRLFLYFAASFGLEVVCRFLLIYTAYNSESEPLVYVLRLLSYVVILLAVADKNHLLLKKYLSNLTKSQA